MATILANLPGVLVLTERQMIMLMQQDSYTQNTHAQSGSQSMSKQPLHRNKGSRQSGRTCPKPINSIREILVGND